MKGEMQQMKVAELTGFELYDLTTDVAESTDVQSKFPDQFDRLREKIVELHREVRDEGPVWPAWEFARYEGKRIEWPEYWLKKRRQRK